MKTAISVPDEVYRKADRLARRSGRSRSEVYSAALREYVARHDPDEVTEALDRAIEELAETGVEVGFVDAAARQVLSSTEW
ncbi:MAG: ribbon-helix-helix protein, CopG family [Chloroflexi bacterium]|nr:ribbon-helix-helix protein, CopG family [Chloroflexota bacterium]